MVPLTELADARPDQYQRTIAIGVLVLPITAAHLAPVDDRDRAALVAREERRDAEGPALLEPVGGAVAVLQHLLDALVRVAHDLVPLLGCLVRRRACVHTFFGSIFQFISTI